jgi:hypothetical protein
MPCHVGFYLLVVMDIAVIRPIGAVPPSHVCSPQVSSAVCFLLSPGASFIR